MINAKAMTDEEKVEYAELTVNVIEMFLKYADKKGYDRDELLDDFLLRMYALTLRGSFQNYVTKEDKKNEDPWNPADVPPNNDRAILVSIEHEEIPGIGYCRKNNDGKGVYYFYLEDEELELPIWELGFHVNGWMELPRCKREENKMGY